MELDPAYVDVGIKRWQAFKGAKGASAGPSQQRQQQRQPQKKPSDEPKR